MQVFSILSLTVDNKQDNFSVSNTII